MSVPSVEKPAQQSANAKEKDVVVVQGESERRLILYRPLTRPTHVDPIRGERPAFTDADLGRLLFTRAYGDFFTRAHVSYDITCQFDLRLSQVDLTHGAGESPERFWGKAREAQDEETRGG
ncbi:hypothetical protein FB45DRAFT_1030818 [Roridomyces roridus]|uniref:Uncharacterized protein n=1 Tax=Roridomyces roridus TaxID=1738132 RepID=A0AAD7FKR8_9AGAR|nr:hypothetical protein FB45DRAFT_1030818 [Roridomyces roridus]